MHVHRVTNLKCFYEIFLILRRIFYHNLNIVGYISHYSKNIIFVQKFNFDKTLLSNIFEFGKYYWLCHPQKIEFTCQKSRHRIGQSKLYFWTKNEGLEQCVHWQKCCHIFMTLNCVERYAKLYFTVGQFPIFLHKCTFTKYTEWFVTNAHSAETNT